MKGGVLSFQLFKEIVDKNIWVSRIELSNWGEIFLNPHLLEIMKYAYSQGVGLTADNGVNLNTASDEVLEALVKYRFLFMSCSIDGATPEVYAIYRKGGDLSKVLSNVKRINYFKEKYNSPFPLLQWQFVAHGHNEHEITTARLLSRELGMHFFLKLQWGDLYGETFSPIKDEQLIRSFSPDGVATRKEYKEKTGHLYNGFMCHQLWNRPQINFDGRILGCCYNYWGDFGHIGDGDLSAAVNNEKMIYAREMLSGNQPANPDIPCSTCSIYEHRVQAGDWVKSPGSESLPKLSRTLQKMAVPRYLNRLFLPLINRANWGIIEKALSIKSKLSKTGDRMAKSG